MYLYIRPKCINSIHFTYQLDSPASNFNVSMPDFASNSCRLLDHQLAASGFVKSI